MPPTAKYSQGLAVAEQPVVTISPQEMVISNRDVILRTLLGSCVAICLHDGRETGAMCHALLPRYVSPKGGKDSVKEKLKYVDSSLELMLERFDRMGILPQRLDARLYGGANMFDVQQKGLMDVGRKNIEAATTLLQRYGIRICTMDVGGKQGRKVGFNPRSGDVSLYLVPADTVFQSEVDR